MFKLLISFILVFLVSPTPKAPRLRSSKASYVEVHSGEPFTVACHVLSMDSSVTIQWFHNGVLLPISGLSSTLLVSNASEVDAGEYFCKVRNEHGAVLSPSTFVIVRYFRGFVVGFEQPVATVRAQIGGWAILKPPPLDAVSAHIDWRWHYGESPSEMILFYVRSLIAEWSGKRHFRLNVQIIVKPVDVTIVSSSENAQLSVKDASMDCVAFYKDLSHIHVSWRLNGNVIPDDDVHYSVRDFSRRLIIHKPTVRDSGNYSCYATANGVTVHESATLSIVDGNICLVFFPFLPVSGFAKIQPY
ncbi:unnamed protein product [Soboliphyme baturini]|uniref:Ig-like domain-containing protein n=1 Tax=Soboliphyme baturini TaxID=241478 RepID=A0A183J4D4_9BILA|nr:unnamed protein product [Soboliphyme baturini]